MRLVFRPEAEADVEAAFGWYESRRAGLGREFIAALDAIVNSIAENPLRFPSINKDIRRALVRRFPYSVFFLARREEVSVLGVLHARRDPKTWKKRTY